MTKTKDLFNVLQLLEFAKEGSKFKATTDNNYYGITIVKKNGELINVRTEEALQLTSELLQTKFKLVNEEKEVTLGAFLEAYKAGKEVKVVVGDQFRTLQREEVEELPEALQHILNVFAFQREEVLTLTELTEGKFYIVD